MTRLFALKFKFGLRLAITLLLTLPFHAYSSEQTIVVLGDSLSAAYGINEQDGWVALLQKRLDDEGFDYAVINASISGETSAGGLTRFSRLLKQYHPSIVILALGANDGLRGLSLMEMKTNLANIINQAQINNAEVLLVGMQLPPNYGQAFNALFSDTFEQLASDQQIALVPFLLDGIGENKTMFQQDGLHPTANAQAKVLDNIWPTLKQMLKSK